MSSRDPEPLTPAATADEWLTTGRFAVLISILVFITFPSVVIGSRTFIIRDYGLFSYPVAFFQRACFWQGEIPMWNPYSQCGLPFLAQWNTMCLYPLALFYLLLPLTWALPVFCLAHLVWGGLGMYLLARHWTVHHLAAAVAGVIFAFNGLNLNFLMWPSHVATFSWLPWVLWLVPQGWRHGGRRMLWATLAASLQMLAGGPETVLLTWVMLALLATGDWLRQVSPLNLIFFRLAGMAGLVALLCAAQLLPFLELLTRSQRDSGFGSAAWAMPGLGWANFLVPLFHSSLTPQGIYLQTGQYWTSSYYAGIGTVLLAAVGLWRERDWRIVTIWILVSFAAILALGDHGLLYQALRSWVPGMGLFRYPVKFVILILALAPLLAAFGVKALTSGACRLGRFEWMISLILVLLVGILVGLEAKAPTDAWRVIAENGAARAAFLIATLLLLGLLAKSSATVRTSSRNFCGVLLLAVFWLDFVTHVPSQNPTASPAVYSPALLKGARQWTPEPALGRSRAMLSPEALQSLKYHAISNLDDGYLLDRLALLADCNLLERVPQVYGFFSLAPGEANNVTVVPYIQTNRDFSRLFDFMGVVQLTAPGKIFDFSPRATAMPLVTAGQEPVFADDPAVFAALSQTNADFRRIVFLPVPAHSEVIARRQADARVDCTGFANQSVTMVTHSPAPCLVVIAQSWYPAWRAYVDGEPAKLWRANYAFQAVQVPAGSHQVTLRYQDRVFLAGVILSGLGIMLLLGLYGAEEFRLRIRGGRRS